MACLLLISQLSPGLAQTPEEAGTGGPDLTGLVLSIGDIDRLDQMGYTHDAASLKRRPDQVADLAAACGITAELVSSPVAMAIEGRLVSSGWQRQYVVRAGLADSADPAHFTRIITTAMTAYEETGGAAAGFAYLHGGEGNCFETGEPVSWEGSIGDESAIRHIVGPGDDVETLVLAFRRDSLVASVALTSVNGEVPQIAMLEALGQRMLERIENATDSETSLPNAVMRLNAPAIPAGARLYGVVPGMRLSATLQEGYLRRDGRDIPMPNETAGGYVARQEAFGMAFDVYQLRHTLGDGLEAGPVYRVVLARFENAEAAATFFPGVQAFAHLQGLGQVAVVGDARMFGDESLVLAFQLDHGEAAMAGYLISVRKGTEVAIAVLLAQQAPPLDAVSALMEAQMECLAAGECAERQPVPESLNL